MPNSGMDDPVRRVKRVISTDEVEREAYYQWEREGKPEGEAVRHWLESESWLHARAA